jgi:hypothetical protein
MGVRDLALPWVKQGMPPWLEPGRRMHYRGTYSNSLAEGLLPPWGFEALVAVDRVTRGFATGSLVTRLDFGTGTPQESRSAIVSGAGVLGALFVDPAVLGRLAPGQVIDEDQITRRRTSVVGRDAGHVTIGEAGPIDSALWTYDTRTGMLVGVGAQQQQGPATITMRAQLADPR